MATIFDKIRAKRQARARVSPRNQRQPGRPVSDSMSSSATASGALTSDNKTSRPAQSEAGVIERQSETWSGIESVQGNLFNDF